MLTIRPSRPADNALIKACFAAALPRYQALMPGSFEANLANMDILTEKGLGFNATGLEGWILSAAGNEVGFAGIGLLNPSQAYMAALYLLPDQQRRGYGQAALDQLEPHYAGLGCCEMLLLVHRDAGWARDFYLRAGYRLIAAQPEAIIAHAGERLAHLLEPDLLLLGKAIAPETKRQEDM